MPANLTENEYCWQVSWRERTAEGRVDSVHAYFTDRALAEKKAESIRRGLHKNGVDHLAVVEQTTLWHDGKGNYSRVVVESVDVDLPEREDVLARLSRAERRALGLG